MLLIQVTDTSFWLPPLFLCLGL